MNEDFYINLLYKKLAEEISPSEQAQLDTWVAASDENRRSAASVEKAWMLSANLQPKVRVDLDEEFSKLEALMGDDKQETGKVRSLDSRPSSGRNWLAIAATFLVLAVAAFLLRSAFSGDTNAPAQWAEVSAEKSNQILNLSDGSKVYLNKGATFKSPSVFAGQQRIVELKGEAFFEVSHDADKPFIIKTLSETVTVLGTSFSVNTSKKDVTSVYVATGKVELAQNNTTAKVILTKEEKGVSNTNTKQVQHLGKQSANELAWHTRRLQFVDTALAEVVEKVENLYNIQIRIENIALQNCPFTDTFDKLELSTVLESISTVLSAEIVLENDVYILKGGDCEF